MSKYIPMPAYVDSMPVDISFVFESEKPAGKHGFCQVKGDQFVFEDGTPARFWGVNFNGGANFPEHDYAEKVARRLAQAGCNIARFHQLDAEWDTPNIYAYTKGKRLTTTRVLDETSMDRLDYLIYALKKNGIYCYMDMMTYRKFKSGDGVPYATTLGDSAKPFSVINRRMIELQKEFCDQFWNHYNPYTKLCHKDDPVFVMTEITNECDIFRIGGQVKSGHPYYVNELRTVMQKWMDEHGIEYDCMNGDIVHNSHPVSTCKRDLTMAYYRELRDYMRSIGVKIPITGNNFLHNSYHNVDTEVEMDFSDSHLYYYDWRWGEVDKFCANEQINGHRVTLQKLAISALHGQPFYVSEWDMPWPNGYRAEGPIYHAALSALQGWSGMAIHTYAYGTKLEDMKILGKELSSSTIGGIPYREGIFSVWNDPAKFGLFYHAALIVRRGDVSPANKLIGVRLPDLDDVQELPQYSHLKEDKASQMLGTWGVWGAYTDAMELHRMRALPQGHDGSGCDMVVDLLDTIEHDPKLIVSDNGQVWRNLEKKFGGIDTPMTKVVYGKLTAGRNASAGAMAGTEVGGMKVVSKSDFAVIALSSLTEDPIEKSDNMLLSTIGRARNTDQVFDGDKLVDIGKPPILAEVIEAEITIATERTDLQVWGVNAEGFYVGRVPAKFEDGHMRFTVGKTLPACYYLIVAE